MCILLFADAAIFASAHADRQRAAGGVIGAAAGAAADRNDLLEQTDRVVGQRDAGLDEAVVEVEREVPRAWAHVHDRGRVPLLL